MHTTWSPFRTENHRVMAGNHQCINCYPVICILLLYLQYYPGIMLVSLGFSKKWVFFLHICIFFFFHFFSAFMDGTIGSPGCQVLRYTVLSSYLYLFVLIVLSRRHHTEFRIFQVGLCRRMEGRHRILKYI